MNYNTNIITGIFQIFKGSDWRMFSYLQNKDILKICSFFNFTFGTTTLEEVSSSDVITKLMETIDCPLNATNVKNCLMKNSKRVMKYFQK